MEKGQWESTEDFDYFVNSPVKVFVHRAIESDKQARCLEIKEWNNLSPSLTNSKMSFPNLEFTCSLVSDADWRLKMILLQRGGLRKHHSRVINALFLFLKN